MTKRARALFDEYVIKYLNRPELASLGLQSHAHNLRDRARSQGIPLEELTDEVGPLPVALAEARNRT